MTGGSGHLKSKVMEFQMSRNDSFIFSLLQETKKLVIIFSPWCLFKIHKGKLLHGISKHFGSHAAANLYLYFLSFLAQKVQKGAAFVTEQYADGEKHLQILFMETLRVSSLGHSARKRADTLSTLFLLRSSVLISGRHSGTCSSFTLLLREKHRHHFFYYSVVTNWYKLWNPKSLRTNSYDSVSKLKVKIIRWSWCGRRGFLSLSLLPFVWTRSGKSVREIGFAQKLRSA